MIAAHLGRLWVHYRTQPSDADADLILADWTRSLAAFDDDALKRACQAWLDNEQWMPTLSGIIEATQEEQRIAARSRAERALPAGPRNDEPVADSKVAVRAIRAAGVLHLPPASTWAELEGRASLDIEGLMEVAVTGPLVVTHDHKRGAAECPTCSQHDHSDPEWRETCPKCGVPGPPPEPMWSDCSGCDGSHYVFTGSNSVHPCPECNPTAYRLWLGGHMRAGHRCEECAPTRRRRAYADD